MIRTHLLAPRRLGSPGDRRTRGRARPRQRADRLLRASLLGVLLLGAGCEETGQVRVAWSFAGAPVQNAYDCARYGVERVVVSFEDAGGQVRAQVERPCGHGDTGVREVPVGTYRVRVQGFGPTGQPFTDPATGETSMVTTVEDVGVASSGVAEVTADLSPNPPCADFVDNDGDGLVDASDPGCYDRSGHYDPDPARGEEDDVGPGLLAVRWQINGGRDTCDEVQPTGAVTASLRVDGLETSRFPCGNGSGQVTLAPGSYAVSLALLGPDEAVLAVTAPADASIVQDVTTTVDFDIAPSDFTPAQTGLLRLSISWGAEGVSCEDASPMVDEQALSLRDATDLPVPATTLAGVPADGTYGACVGAGTAQGIAEALPVGTYQLTVAGRSANGQACYYAADLPVRVDIGPNPVLELVVPPAAATALCAP